MPRALLLPRTPVVPSAPALTPLEDPTVGVVHVPERDHARLVPGRLATRTTGAHPGRGTR